MKGPRRMGAYSLVRRRRSYAGRLGRARASAVRQRRKRYLPFNASSVSFDSSRGLGSRWSLRHPTILISHKTLTQWNDTRPAFSGEQRLPDCLTTDAVAASQGPA